MDADGRESLQCAQVGQLPLRLLRVVGTLLNLGREVSDLLDVILRQEPLAEAFEVEPLVRTALETAVEEIEAVDVDVRGHDAPRQPFAGTLLIRPDADGCTVHMMCTAHRTRIRRGLCVSQASASGAGGQEPPKGSNHRSNARFAGSVMFRSSVESSAPSMAGSKSHSMSVSSTRRS